MELDAYQQAAATTRKEQVLVSAVPGSGKTRTLVARFEYMVKELNLLQSQIAMITFTRYAANEMRERLEGKVGGAFIGTFHAFALRLIRLYGRRRGWEPSWLTILDELDVDIEQKDVLRDLHFLDRQNKWVKCKQKDWWEYRNAIVNGTEIPAATEALFAVPWKTFCDRLRAQNCMTFGTLILEALALLDDPETGPDIRKKFRHLLVDEAQDTDRTQWRIIRLLEPETLWICGDSDQAIFAWRGAAPSLFRQYALESKRYDLPNSYRFGFNIAAPANALIKHNHDRLDMAIKAIAENQGSVKVATDAQYDGISKIIMDELNAGVRPEQIVVLARRHKTLKALAVVLERDRVPFTRIGGQDAVPLTPEFRVIKGYLRLAINQRDRRAFMSIATAEHLTTVNLWEIRKASLRERQPLLMVYGKELPRTVDDLEKYLAEYDPPELGRNYVPGFAYLRDVMYHEALAETDELVQYLSMEAAQDQLRSVEDTVVLCTVHAAKGLEWPTVLVIGLNSKQFPSPMALREGREEEERRLLYVAMTRAEERLYLVQNEPESSKDGPSLFLGQVGEVEKYWQERLDLWDGDDLRM